MIIGTRASFWLGNPRNLENRKWLGCIAFDGYPEGDTKKLIVAKNEEQFVELLEGICKDRRDFASPEGDWPFPWEDDIFLTDFTYAFFDGKTQVANFHSGFITMEDYFEYYQNNEAECLFDREDLNNKLPKISALKPYDSSQPDSIIIIKR